MASDTILCIRFADGHPRGLPVAFHHDLPLPHMRAWIRRLDSPVPCDYGGAIHSPLGQIHNICRAGSTAVVRTDCRHLRNTILLPCSFQYPSVSIRAATSDGFGSSGRIVSYGSSGEDVVARRHRASDLHPLGVLVVESAWSLVGGVYCTPLIVWHQLMRKTGYLATI